MSSSNSNVYVPPPPEKPEENIAGTEGIILKITSAANVSISHTYIEKEVDPTEHCLIVIDVNKKADMCFEWADPKWPEDDTRLTQLNSKLDDGKIIIISADVVMLDGTAGESAARVFWSKNGMSAIEKFKYAPDLEYYGSNITGKANTIQIIKGWAKIIG